MKMKGEKRKDEVSRGKQMTSASADGRHLPHQVGHDGELQGFRGRDERPESINSQEFVKKMRCPCLGNLAAAPEEKRASV